MFSPDELRRNLTILTLSLLPSAGACASSPSPKDAAPANESARGSGEQTESHTSGAYEALGLWAASRAYPEKDIPDAAYTRGYEFSKRTLRVAGDTPARSNLTAGRRGGGRESLAPERVPRRTWKALGPTNGGGRMLTIAFDPTNPSTVWAGSASGGLWRSATGGVGAAAWERIDTGHPVLGVSTIAFDPADPNVMYIGTGEVYNHQAAGNLAADRATRGSYGIGILKSTDGGGTWSKSLDWSYNQKHGVWAVRVDPTNSNIVWAATTDGVYKSTNAGASWNQSLSTVMAMDLVVHPTTPDTVLVGCGNLSSAGRGFYRTTNGGTAWSQVIGGGVPADFAGKIQLGVTPADPDVVYASVGNGFSFSDGFTWLLKSTDFGASFSQENTLDYSRWQGWYSHDVDASPSDADDLLAIGIDVFKSSNGGATLTQKTNWQLYFTGHIPSGDPEGPGNYSHADHHDVVYHPTDPDIAYLATDGGVFRSTDGGDNWVSANGGLQTQQFYNGTTSYATDPDLAMGGLQDNATVIYRGDGDWARWVLGGDGGWGAIDAGDPDTVFATAQNLFVGRSTNGGNSFGDVSPPSLGGPSAFISPLVMAPSNSNVLYGATSFLFRTTNGAAGWSTMNGGAPLDSNPILVIAVAPQNQDVVYLATAPLVTTRTVQRSLNGGAGFTDVTGSLPDRFPGDLTVDPNDEATVYLTLSGFGSSHLFRSTDYGASWTDIDGGRLPDVPTSAVVVDPLFPDHVYVGNDLGVYFTRNGGRGWAQLDRGLPEAVMVTDLGISPVDRKLRAFTHGLGAFEVDLVGDLVETPPTLPGEVEAPR